MIKIFNANDRDFSTTGNIIINPIKCLEIKKKSLNGWYIEVEIPIKYKEYIEKDKLCVVQTKSKVKPQAFRISENIQYSNRKIKFTANHVMFDAKDYVLIDVRPTKLNGNNALNYINDRTDNVSPFIIFSNIENISTAYFIRKNLLEAWEVIEERWSGIFDADNWNISFLQSVGNDNGESVIFGKNMQAMEVYEDWSNVVTRIYPVGYDGIMLPEKYLDSDIQYEKPYSRVIDFETDIEYEEQTQGKLINELRTNAQKYLEENKYPKISYTIESNINDKMEIGDIIQVLHPLVKIKTEVLEYEYDIISKKVKSITFGNYSRDVKDKFNNIKKSISQINQAMSKQEAVINNQTNLINMLNKNGYVYIDDNEILILDKIPKEEAKNVWRFGLGGLGFSSNGYEGPFETAITMDGQINAKFITTGTMSVSRIEGLENSLNNINLAIEINGDNITSVLEKVDAQNQKISQVTQTVEKLSSNISDIADLTVSKETTKASLSFENINQSEPIRIEIHPLGENISYLYPNPNLFPSNDLFFKDRKLRFHNTTTNEIFDYKLPDDLLYHDAEHYDEFILDYGGQSCIVNKKVEYNADGSTYILEKETTIEYNFPHIELTDGDYTISLLGYSNAYLFVRLMSKNIYTSQFATKVEVNSEIKQLSDEIDLNVNKKLTNYSTTLEMNSAINLKSDAILSTVNNTLTNYSTTVQMNSAIEQKAESINLELTKKVDNSDYTSAQIMLKINNDTSEAKIKADKVSITANDILNIIAKNTIDLTSKEITIESNAFKVDKNGQVEVIAEDNGDPNKAMFSVHNSSNTSYSKLMPSLLWTSSSYGMARFGAYGWPILHMRNSSNGYTVTMQIGTTDEPILELKGANTTEVKASGITTPKLTQTSIKAKKKNIEKININAIELIKSADICLYNLKEEKQGTKKHIGLLIGEGYNCPVEVISEDKQGVEQYSMTSLAWKAIQELAVRLEKLEDK